MKTVIAAALVALCLGAPAGAATMTFDSLSGEYLANYSEDGIYAQGVGGAIGEYGRTGAAHVDDRGTSFASGLTFTMNSRFNALDFSLIASSFNYYVFLDGYDVGGDRELIADSYDNVLVEGRRDGVVVASDQFNMRDFATYTFSAGFRNLDSLYIGAGDFPDPGFYGPIPDGYSLEIYADSPSAHFHIDRVAFAAVPLPSALGLFACAVGLLGLGGRRYRGWRSVTS